MYCSVLVFVDVVQVNVIMGAGMDSLVMDVVDVNVNYGCRHAFASILFRCRQQYSCSCGIIYTNAMTVDAHLT